MASDYIESFYRETRRVSIADTVPLAGHEKVDVAIVGGGVTGCSAALHLAERGYRVALLEAERIGWGASGRSGGQVLTGFGTEMSVMARSLGQDGARQAWEMSREAVRLTADLIQRHDIYCDLRWGAIYAALKPRHVRGFREQIREMRETYDYDGYRWLDRDALYERVRSRAYLGGILDPDSGHLHPLNYTLGLARAAQNAGATIYENSAVTRLEHGKPARLTTAAGSLDADFVVLAGNAYLGSDIEPALRGTLMPVGNYIAATEPLSAEQVEQTLPCDDAVSDANFVLDYFHLSADRRMLYGGQVSYGKKPPRRLRERLAGKLARLFPVLHGIRMDYLWSGLVGVTFDRAPHFGRLGGNIYFSQGYSGHGMAFAGLSGKLMADAIAGQAERFDLYTRLSHRRFPGGERLRTPLLVLATHFYRMRDLL